MSNGEKMFLGGATKGEHAEKEFKILRSIGFQVEWIENNSKKRRNERGDRERGKPRASLRIWHADTWIPPYLVHDNTT